MLTPDLIAAARALNDDLQDIDGVGYVVSDSVVAALHAALDALPPDPRVVSGALLKEIMCALIVLGGIHNTDWPEVLANRLRAAIGQDKEKADG